VNLLLAATARRRCSLKRKPLRTTFTADADAHATIGTAELVFDIQHG
jgi:hypothetical protein